jgi:serine protease Do
MRKIIISIRKRTLSILVMSAFAGVIAPTIINANPIAAAASMASLPDFSELVDKVGPAVVNIRTTAHHAELAAADDQDEQMQEFFRRFFGVPVPGQDQNPNQATPGPKNKKSPKAPKVVPGDADEQSPRGIGSGFIISQDGYIMTNAHVVDGADEVFVKLTDNREFKAKIIGLDARTDVAVLKIEGTGLPKVTIGDSAKAKVGEWVIAIGSPFDLENTVTAGIISAKARETGDFLPLIQTDVAVNPGNSGGPLINMRGEVVGINSQIYSKSGGFMGISFAVPIDEAMGTANQLKSTGHITRGRLGVYLGEVNKELAESLGLPSAKGSVIGRVEKDGPAEKAGLTGGDIIIKYNNVAVDKSADLRRLVAATKPGSKVNVVVWRKGAAQTIAVTLAEVEPDKVEVKAQGDTPSDSEIASNAFGIDVVNLTDAQKKELQLSGGVLITSVDGATVRPGLHEGDIILTLNNVDVKTVAQFTALAAKTDTKKTIVLLVRRGENAQFVSLKPVAK